MSLALVAVPQTASGSPRSPGYGRAFGRVTVFGGQAGRTVPLGGALVRAYAPGTATPWALPLYGDEAATDPLVFPLALGEDGGVALWADAPARVELLVEAPGYLPERAVLDLEPPPDAVAGAGEAYTKEESDARFAAQPLTAAQIPAEFVTVAEGDARYAPLGGGGAGAVDSVNGYTGVVVLAAADVGALTQAAGDARYEPLESAFTKAESDARYIQGGGVARITVNAVAPGSPATGDLWVW